MACPLIISLLLSFALQLLLIILWLFLLIQNSGGPAFTKDDYCMTCLVDGARTVVSADSYRDHRKSMKEIADSVLSGKFLDGTHYLPKAWYDQWCKHFAFGFYLFMYFLNREISELSIALHFPVNMLYYSALKYQYLEFLASTIRIHFKLTAILYNILFHGKK